MYHIIAVKAAFF